MEAAQWPGLVTNGKPTPAYNYGKHLSKNPNKHHAQSTPSSDSALAHLPGLRKQGPRLIREFSSFYLVCPVFLLPLLSLENSILPKFLRKRLHCL